MGFDAVPDCSSKKLGSPMQQAADATIETGTGLGKPMALWLWKGESSPEWK